MNLSYLCCQLTQFYFVPVGKQFNSKPNLDIRHVGQTSSGVKNTDNSSRILVFSFVVGVVALFVSKVFNYLPQKAIRK